MLVLDIAVTLVRKEIEIERMSTFPRLVVRLFTECLNVFGASRERKHGNRFAYPNSVFLKPLLPLSYKERVILACFNEIRLHPWDGLTGLEQQVSNSFGAQAAVLVQVV